MEVVFNAKCIIFVTLFVSTSSLPWKFSRRYSRPVSTSLYPKKLSIADALSSLYPRDIFKEERKNFLTREQFNILMEHLVYDFMMYDTDGSGTLSRGELKTKYLESVGDGEYVETMLTSTFGLYDNDSSGDLDSNELLEYLKSFFSGIFIED